MKKYITTLIFFLLTPVKNALAAEAGVQADGTGGILSTTELVNILEDLILSKNPRFKENLIQHVKNHVERHVKEKGIEADFKTLTNDKLQTMFSEKLAANIVEFLKKMLFANVDAIGTTVEWLSVDHQAVAFLNGGEDFKEILKSPPPFNQGTSTAFKGAVSNAITLARAPVSFLDHLIKNILTKLISKIGPNVTLSSLNSQLWDALLHSKDFDKGWHDLLHSVLNNLIRHMKNGYEKLSDERQKQLSYQLLAFQNMNKKEEPLFSKKDASLSDTPSYGKEFDKIMIDIFNTSATVSPEHQNVTVKVPRKTRQETETPESKRTSESLTNATRGALSEEHNDPAISLLAQNQSETPHVSSPLIVQKGTFTSFQHEIEGYQNMLHQRYNNMMAHKDLILHLRKTIKDAEKTIRDDWESLAALYAKIKERSDHLQGPERKMLDNLDKQDKLFHAYFSDQDKWKERTMTDLNAALNQDKG